MHADDTNYTVIKNGVVVVSGTGPAIRVEGNRLVIRDGPQETKPLVLTRAGATRKLRHVIVCGHAGGFITFDALRWLRDTGVAFSQLDWDGSVIVATGPRGPDRPALRRAQVLVCSGAIPKTARPSLERSSGEIERSSRRCGRNGIGGCEHRDRQPRVRTLCETDGSKLLSVEARAAAIYWKLWRDLPVRFARSNPHRLGPNGRWRPGRSELWLTFGPRASVLTGGPFRATTPGNALLNYLVRGSRSRDDGSPARGGARSRHRYVSFRYRWTVIAGSRRDRGRPSSRRLLAAGVSRVVRLRKP